MKRLFRTLLIVVAAVAAACAPRERTVVLLSTSDGIISMGDMKKVGSVGWKTVAYFLGTTAAACGIGLVFANLFNNAGWFPTLALEDGAVRAACIAAGNAAYEKTKRLG